MTEPFKEQGGAATMDPGPVLRWVTSKIMSRVIDPTRLANTRTAEEKRRQRAGEPHIVEYFHQVDDGYSYLATQVLAQLCERYDIELRCHLVSAASDKNAPEPELLLQLSRVDAAAVAPEYGLDFPADTQAPSTERISTATAILASLDDGRFIEHAAGVGRALWHRQDSGLEELASQLGKASAGAVEERIARGNARRETLKHYSGAMFYYGGEWYWGVDRLNHLEGRLAELGADRHPGEEALVPRPDILFGPEIDEGRLTLEIYASLRSPYTAIAFDRAVELARKTGVKLDVRPVLPMVMRGVPATRTKGMYIFSDAAREARASATPFGKFYDPIGNPARRGYALYEWASEQGRGVEMFASLLRCAFAEGVNLNRSSGLRTAVEKAGLDWSQAKNVVKRDDWQQELETNRLTMYGSGLWGVPSFRLLDEDGKELLALWGQDRLWLFSRVIQQQLQKRTTQSNNSSP